MNKNSDRDDYSEEYVEIIDEELLSAVPYRKLLPEDEYVFTDDEIDEIEDEELLGGNDNSNQEPTGFDKLIELLMNPKYFREEIVNAFSPKHRKKTLYVLFSVFFFICLVWGGIWYNTPINVFNRCVESQNYTSAVEIYNEKLFGVSKKQNLIDENIVGYIDEIVSNYNTNDINYEQAKQLLSPWFKSQNKELAGYALIGLVSIDVNEKEYSELVELFNDKISNNPTAIDKATELINSHIDEISAAYFAGNTTYQEAVDVLNQFNKINSEAISVVLSNTLSRIITQNTAEGHLEKAEKLYSNGDFLGAIKEFQKVTSSSSEDTFNTAQTRIHDCCEKVLEKYSSPSSISDYLSYIQELNEAKKVIDDKLITNRIANLEAECTKKVIEQVQNYEGNSKFDDAIALVRQVLGVYSSTELNNLLTTIGDHKIEFDDRTLDYTAGNMQFNVFTGNVQESDIVTHYFDTDEEGRYCFNATNLRKGVELKVVVYDSTNEIIGDSPYYLKNNNAFKLVLSAQSTYSFTVEGYYSTGDYTIQVGYPKPLINLAKYNLLRDSIECENQKNHYTFTPAETGNYRFDFDNMVNGLEIHFVVVNSLDYDEDNGYYKNNQGTTCRLKKDEKYDIYVYQSSGQGNYNMNIGKQKSTRTMTDYSTMRDSITFIDQDNYYEFVATDSELHIFTLDNMVSNLRCDIKIIDSLGYTCAERSGLESGAEIEAELKKGETYKIIISQSKSTGKYTLKIT